jgi:hypothetical protein
VNGNPFLVVESVNSKDFAQHSSPDTAFKYASIVLAEFDPARSYQLHDLDLSISDPERSILKRIQVSRCCTGREDFCKSQCVQMQAREKQNGVPIQASASDLA